MTAPELTRVPGAEPRYDDDGNEIVEVLTCGTCGRSWNDAAISAVTPAPAGRCPFEDEHEYEDDAGEEEAPIMVAPTVTLDELIAAVRDGDPVPASDEALLAVAFAACEELRSRMPRYAFEQGDLDWTDAFGVARMETAEDAVRVVEAMREAWGRSDD